MTSELKKASVGPVFIGAILIFLLFGLIVWIWFGLTPKADSYEQKRADIRFDKLNLLEKDNHEKLVGYAWVNKAKGVVQLPIDRAQELVVAELKSKPVKASSVKVEVPYPAGLQQQPAPAASGTSAVPAASPVAAASPAGSPAVASPAPAANPAPSATPAASPAAPSPTPAAASSPA